MTWQMRTLRQGHYVFTSALMHATMVGQGKSSFSKWMVESGDIVYADCICKSENPPGICWPDLTCHGKAIGSVERHDPLLLGVAFEIWSETKSVFAAGFANIQFLHEGRPVHLYLVDTKPAIRIDMNYYDLADPRCLDRVLEDHFQSGNRI